MCCVLLCVRCSLFVVCCLLCAECMLCVVWSWSWFKGCALCVVCYMMIDVCCLLFDVCCLLIDV